jgi:8-oxo-dGTP pyrophosphatase MutT (NUDIX family)
MPTPTAKSRAKSAITPAPTIAHHTEVIARGVLFHLGRVLVCLPRGGAYAYLPGGHVEFAEAAADALAREFAEECGIRPTVGPLLLAAENVFATAKRRHHEWLLMFHVEHRRSRDLETLASIEPDIEFRWCTPAEFRRLDVRPAFMAQAVLKLPRTVWAGNAPKRTCEWVGLSHSRTGTSAKRTKPRTSRKRAGTGRTGR